MLQWVGIPNFILPPPPKESTHITTDCVKIWKVIKQPMYLN